MHSIQVYTSHFSQNESHQVEAYVIDNQSGKEELCGMFVDYQNAKRTIICVKVLMGNDVKFIKGQSAGKHSFKLCEVRIFGRYI